MGRDDRLFSFQIIFVYSKAILYKIRIFDNVNNKNTNVAKV